MSKGLFFSPDIQTRDPAWYQALTQALDEEQGKQLHDIGTLADQRRAAHGKLVNNKPAFSGTTISQAEDNWTIVLSCSLALLCRKHVLTVLSHSRIQDDREAWRIQVHGSSGAI